MQIRNAHRTDTRTTYNEQLNLLDCRMAMLGLDLYAVESDDSEMFEELKHRCISCRFQGACAVDLKRDPNNPVWETYCPNAAAFFELAEAQWLLH